MHSSRRVLTTIWFILTNALHCFQLLDFVCKTIATISNSSSSSEANAILHKEEGAGYVPLVCHVPIITLPSSSPCVVFHISWMSNWHASLTKHGVPSIRTQVVRSCVYRPLGSWTRLSARLDMSHPGFSGFQRNHSKSFSDTWISLGPKPTPTTIKFVIVLRWQIKKIPIWRRQNIVVVKHFPFIIPPPPVYLFGTLKSTLRFSCL